MKAYITAFFFTIEQLSLDIAIHVHAMLRCQLVLWHVAMATVLKEIESTKTETCFAWSFEVNKWTDKHFANYNMQWSCSLTRRKRLARDEEVDA